MSQKLLIGLSFNHLVCNVVFTNVKNIIIMTIKQAIEIVELHNKWRRDNDNKFKMGDPKEIGVALDILVGVAKNVCKIYSRDEVEMYGDE
jgi:hypothetical protein